MISTWFYELIYWIYAVFFSFSDLLLYISDPTHSHKIVIFRVSSTLHITKQKLHAIYSMYASKYA